jgi:hypothetical protein
MCPYFSENGASNDEFIGAIELDKILSILIDMHSHLFVLVKDEVKGEAPGDNL